MINNDKVSSYRAVLLLKLRSVKYPYFHTTIKELKQVRTEEDLDLFMEKYKLFVAYFL